MKTIVVLTGAGISAESGISTFRDNNGLWRQYRFEEVASPEAWAREPELVMDFYNMRRKQLLAVKPNAAHFALEELEKKFRVRIITQNVDDLHERSGSSDILHLHGELRKARSTADKDLVYDISGWELKLGDFCEKGSQLRPHIVWFGETVPNIMVAAGIVRKADIIIIIGTSLKVYPAAGLLQYAPSSAPKYLIDPEATPEYQVRNLQIFREKACIGVPKLVKELLISAVQTHQSP
ncbi:MAG: NAD-dependent deacylase [Bacteroidetes bacterium]|nr:NAD-dependent deacylase [Bacteroidota bacterium]